MTPASLFCLATAPDVSWVRTAPPVAEAADGLPIGLIVALAVGASLVAFAVTLLLRHDRSAHGPAVRRLARGLGVGLADRRLLDRVARHGGLTCAGSLLLSRGCFEEAARRWNADAARLDAIRRAVFMR